MKYRVEAQMFMSNTTINHNKTIKCSFLLEVFNLRILNNLNVLLQSNQGYPGLLAGTADYWDVPVVGPSLPTE